MGYSEWTETKQLRTFNSMQREVNYIFYDEITSNKIVIIPTGDGMIIGLQDEGNVSAVKSIDAVKLLLGWSKNENISFRYAIHVGNVNLVKDINNKDNLVGNLINDGSRLLAGGGADSIIISEDFFRKFLHNPNIRIGEKYNVDGNVPFTVIDEGTVIDKHGFCHNIYIISLIKDNNETIGATSKILTNFYTQIYTSEYPKDINLKTSFAREIEFCSDLVFLGIYNKSVPKTIELINLSDERNIKIAVVYASDKLEEEIKLFFPCYEQTKEDKQYSINTIKAFKASHANVTLEILEYDIIPSFGASFVDIDKKGHGYMHISNYIRGIVPSKTPYFNLEWKGNNPPHLYKFYKDYYEKKLYAFLKPISITAR